jgi:hypothetical protein
MSRFHPRRRFGGGHDTAHLFVKGHPRPPKASPRPFNEVIASLDPAVAAKVLKVLLTHTSLRPGSRSH